MQQSNHDQQLNQEQHANYSKNLHINTDVEYTRQNSDVESPIYHSAPVRGSVTDETRLAHPIPRHASFYGQIYGSVDRGDTPGGVQLPARRSIDRLGEDLRKTLSLRDAEDAQYEGVASADSLEDSALTPRPFDHQRLEPHPAPFHPQTNSCDQMMMHDLEPRPVTAVNSQTVPANLNVDHERRQRASNLAAFIKSGEAEQPVGPAVNMPMGPAGRGNQMTRTGFAPYVIPQMAPSFQFTARVIPEQIPAMGNVADPLSAGLADMISAGYMTEDILLHHLPVWDAAMQTTNPSEAGVVRITDIPYDTTRQEVIAFFGRNARLLNQPARTPFYAIHIIMERTSAKSMDCFVEFEDENEASEAVRRIHRQYPQPGRKPRIGDRVVQVSLSSQAELMQAVFPRSKCRYWDGQNPVVRSSPEDSPAMGFKGYVTSEEMHMVSKFATTPSRSRFSGKHPQRAYESMITLINKYPWWAEGTWTIGERDSIFNTTRDQMEQLARTVTAREPIPRLTFQLLEELLCTGLSCPGFTDSQRFSLQQASQGLVGQPRFVSPQSSTTPFYALQRRHHLSEQMLELFIHYFRAAFANELQFERTNWRDPFCYLRKLLPSPPQHATFLEVSKQERMVLKQVVEKIVQFGRSLPLPAVHV